MVGNHTWFVRLSAAGSIDTCSSPLGICIPGDFPIAPGLFSVAQENRMLADSNRREKVVYHKELLRQVAWPHAPVCYKTGWE